MTCPDIIDLENYVVGNNLGSILQAEGKLEEAEAMYRRALAIRHKLYGDAHPSLSQSLNNLATVLRDQKKLSEAEQLMRESLAMRRKILPGSQTR